MSLDRRLNAVRDDLADIRLRGRAVAARYAAGRPAVVATGLAPVRHEPRPGSPVGTFFHYGEAVRVFDEGDGYAWCQSDRDSYVGYVAADALSPGGAAVPSHYVRGMGAYRYPEADLRSPPIDFLPRHSPVRVAQAGIDCRGTSYAALADGGFLPEGCLAREPPMSSDLASAAAPYLGCPYLWGGRSFLGIDCSGLVQEAFRDLGIAVPRDTDMQRATIGIAVEIGAVAELARNDLVFVPGHVMIGIGDGGVIHAYGGDMRVRQDPLAGLMKRHGWRLADLTVRRP
ncbi:MAG: C40 family peptidase [Alphaproteobacteria bacterium]|nr:C40 family peptidase [Alphaproteobacteria bacterium]